MRPSKSSNLWLSCGVGALLLLCAGCAGEESEANEADSESEQSLTVDGPESDFDPDKERAIKEKGVAKTPSKEVAEVDRPAASDVPRLDPERLDAEQYERLAEAPLPALVPHKPELLGSATVTDGDHWYAVALDGDGLNVHVSGTRLVFDSPTVGSKEDEAAATDFRISRNHGIVTLSFEAHGAAYSIDVECERPLDDERCTDDDFVISLADDLRLAGDIEHTGGER